MAQVLLIGLGGTGSRIVNNTVADLQSVARRKGEAFSLDDGRMAFAVLDTNVNDMADIDKTLTGITNISTSKEAKIRDYLSQYNDKGVNKWMPHSRTLMEESMIDGASQMRSKSRLALFDTLQRGAIVRLERVINTMIENRELGQKFRVMIVSSLAGGTGAGMFIQTALWVRRYFNNHHCESTIRGVFVLPDVFISTLADMRTSVTEKESLYANAYGAIRELNTLNKILTKGYQPLAPISIDGLFDSDEIEHRAANEQYFGARPVFDYAFLIDSITESGNQMQSIEEYEKFVSRVVYMQLYAPMKTPLYSEEDNFFRIFERSDEPVFGSCGASRALYPTMSVLDYCALRAAQDSVSSGWLKIDYQIDRMKQDQAKREKQGYNPEKINPKLEYIRLFDDEISKKGTDVGANRLFVAIANDVKEPISQEIKGKVVTEWIDKTNHFVKKLDKYITETVQNDYRTSLARINAADALGDITTQDDIIDKVQEITNEVNALVAQFDKELPQKAGLILNRIFTDDMGDVNARSVLSVYSFLTQRDENDTSKFVHPLAARYLLYRLLTALNEKKTQIIIDSDRANALKGYRGEANTVDFDYKHSKEVEETPEDYATAKRSVFESKKKFVEGFKKRYAEHNANQYNLCEKYGIQLLSITLYRMITERLEALIKEIEKFFRELPTVLNTLEGAIAQNVESTSSVRERTVYIYATPENKESVYESVKGSYEENNRDINDIVITNLYGRFCAELNDTSDFNKKYAEQGVVETFSIRVVQTYREELLKENEEKIKLSLYAALCRQVDEKLAKTSTEKKSGKNQTLNVDLTNGIDLSAGAKQAQYQREFASLVERLRVLAAPSLISDNEQPDDPDENLIDNYAADYDDPTFNPKLPTKKHKTFWGFNSRLPEEYDGIAQLLGVNIAQQQNDAYTIDELNCYRAVYGVMAKYIPKLNETKNAEYYSNYFNVITRMNIGVMQGSDAALVDTPHLDKTWHYILPYVTPERQMKEEQRFYKCFWMAIAYNHINLNSKGQFCLNVRKQGRDGDEYEDSELILYKGKPVDIKHFGNLIKALRIDPKFILETQRILNNYLEMDIMLDRDEYENLAIISGMKRVRYVDGVKTVCKEGGLASEGFTNAVSLIARYDTQPDKSNEVIAMLVKALEVLIRDIISDDFSGYEKEELEQECMKMCLKIYMASPDSHKEDIRFFRHWLDNA